MDNIIIALGHNDSDRVCQIDLLGVTNSQLEEVLAAMQQPFPTLTELTIRLDIFVRYYSAEAVRLVSAATAEEGIENQFAVYRLL